MSGMCHIMTHVRHLAGVETGQKQILGKMERWRGEWRTRGSEEVKRGKLAASGHGFLLLHTVQKVIQNIYKKINCCYNSCNIDLF